MLNDDTTDWMAVVENTTFCMREFETPEDARAFVMRLLGAFVSLPTS